jgi:hypothetical protein
MDIGLSPAVIPPAGPPALQQGKGLFRFLFLSLNFQSQAWWHMPVIPALGRLRQEDCEFEVYLNYIVKPYLKKLSFSIFIP